VTEAEAVQNAAADVLASARTAQKEVQAALKTAKANFTEYKPEYKMATETRDQQQLQVQTFMDVNVASFNILSTKISARKKKAIAAAAAEAEAVAKAADEAASAAATAVAKADAEEAVAMDANEVGAVPAAEESSRAEGEPAGKPTVEAATEMQVEKAAEMPVALETAAELGA